MKDYIDMAIEQVKELVEVTKRNAQFAEEKAINKFYEIYLQELAESNNPYSISIYKKGDNYSIVPDNQGKAFEVHIGGPFSADGESTTVNDPDQVLTRAVKKMQKYAENLKRDSGIELKVSYRIGNPTTS